MLSLESGIIVKVAQELLGEPNAQLSTKSELRYGNHGSLAIEVNGNTFYDHENSTGGGVVDLVCWQASIGKPEAVEWLTERGLASVTDDEPQKVKAREVCAYDYRDEDGTLLFQVVRFEPKTFRQRRPDGDRWCWKVKGVKQVPYRLPELWENPLSTVFIAEGEKDCDRLAAGGLTATCNAGGAGKWRKEHAAYLKGRECVILGDNDDAGRDHVQKVAKSLRGIASKIRILDLPGLPEKGDISDWLDAGGTIEELIGLPATEPDIPSGKAEPEEEEEKKRSQTDALVQFTQDHFDLLHDNNGCVYAQDHRTGEVRRLGSRQFKDRLTAGFYEKTKMAVRDQARSEALGTLQAIGRFKGEPKAIHVRVAKFNDKYYLDLCEPGKSRAIEIGAGYWRIVESPVLFVRGESMQPLPTPIQGGSIAPLWAFSNIPKHLRILAITWLIDCLRPDTPYPGLELIGEHGSGKSTAAEALRRVIDPSSCNLRGSPKTVEDIFVSAGQNHIVAYENISHLVGPMQDALAILSTGGGYSKRQLFTDDEEHVINVRRPWLVNGIAIAVTQQDLVDRVISIDCQVIEDRQPLSQMWKNFDAALPGILGGVLDTAAKALAILPTITLAPKDRPRLVEFVMLGQAVAQSAGYPENEFLNRYRELRAETVARTLDSSPVATAILEMIEVNPLGITGLLKDILAQLEHHKPFGAEAWPRSPKGLGDALRRAAPALRQMGIECKSLAKQENGINWCVKKLQTQSFKPTACAASAASAGKQADAEHQTDENLHMLHMLHIDSAANIEQNVNSEAF